MARRTGSKSAVVADPASPREARAWLLEQNELPEGVTVAARGRLSTPARTYFTEQTGRPIVEPVAVEAAE